MKFNAAFVHNYPLVHTYFIGSFFFSSNISQSRLQTGITLFFCKEERIRDLMTKKRFSLVLESWG